MKEYEIKLNDLRRILIGEVPLHFYVEVIFKVAVIYLILMVSMRMMGKRMSSQLSRNEMAAVASLAAAIGVPLMNPDRGILPAIVIAFVIVTIQIFIANKAARDKKFESMTQDHLDTLIEDGVMNTEVMLRTRITRGRLTAQLRAENVTHLGMVNRFYLEANGEFSLLRDIEPLPGLSILPDWDRELSNEVHLKAGFKVCSFCGNGHSGEPENDKTTCSNCKKSTWVYAVKESLTS